jgi:hypothetical protein
LGIWLRHFGALKKPHNTSAFFFFEIVLRNVVLKPITKLLIAIIDPAPLGAATFWTNPDSPKEIVSRTRANVVVALISNMQK